MFKKILSSIELYLKPLERLEKNLKNELNQIYFLETTDEFILTYMEPILKRLRTSKEAALNIQKKSTFQKRPFVYSGLKQEV